MREIKHLKQLTKADYVYSSYEEGNLDVLENLQDMLYEFEVANEEEAYICEIINEIANSYVPIYHHRIWKEASEIPDWIEEAMNEVGGLINGDLISTFQYGISRYNERGLYENIDSLKYNYAILYLDDIYDNQSEYIREKMRGITKDDVLDALKFTDVNDTLGSIVDAMESLIDIPF